MTSPKQLPRHEWAESHEPETMPMVLFLHHAQGLSFNLARTVWTRNGLAPAEFDVLATLRNAPAPHELTPTQLQDSLLITSGGLTKVMLQLETRNLVIRSRHQTDQRVKPIKLTPAGKRLVEKAMRELAATSSAWVRGILEANEISLLTGMLRKLAESDSRQ
ncbi:MAG: MarR family transcriptional regulator [Thiobacillus sp.]|nr:MarR family transcriptional regulator [Thiobacillus sp.]